MCPVAHFAMFLEKFIEQHGVDRFVAHAVRLAFLVTRHQVGIDLRDLLGYEAELRDALGSNSCL